MPVRCAYLDVDYTLAGAGGSVLRDAEAGFSAAAAQALEACSAAGAAVVLVSGRPRAILAMTARLLGVGSFVYEAGGGLVAGGADRPLAPPGAWPAGGTPFAAIAEAGVPELLRSELGARLDHDPSFLAHHEVIHPLRGRVDVEAARAVLRRHGHHELRIVDNGASQAGPAASDRGYLLGPAWATKAAGVAAHRKLHGLARADCIAVGDGWEDLAAAAAVGRCWIVANGAERDPRLGAAVAATPNAALTHAACGAGVLEAVQAALAG
jgi:hydroxymethylpyrimidine pyrophosphatase-like HAD family hydrolase